MLREKQKETKLKCNTSLLDFKILPAKNQAKAIVYQQTKATI